MTLDAADPESGSLRATVATGSVSSGNSQIDSTLVGSDWFDVRNYPQAVFESTSIRAIDDNRYAVTGTLQIRGTTRDIEFTLTLDGEAGARKATGEFTVNRLDFELGAESQADEDTVAYPVTIRFAFEVR
jgi:polyisoprenoid-binding protein YceI